MVLCAGAFGCYAAQGSLPGAQGQGYDLNLSYSRTTLKAVADAITQQVGIAFSYETALAGYPMENLEVSEKGATIEAILAAVFTPRGIDYRVVDKVVVLTRSTRPVPAASAAAKSEVKGVVRDAAGNPMIGVTVTIKGTLVGVSTGVDGGYAIPADGNATLLFSYIGYRPHEEVVGRRTQIDVTMQEDELVMDEVVVVGYGTLKKRNIVGAVENLSGDAVENRPNANITRSLQGQIPGLNIVQVDGKADHAGEVTIRGVNNTFKARVSGGEKTNKLGQGGGALVLIDGAEGDMGSVNPDDIASISVLKDASSAAVYGARGAFGVILITTKDPEKGKVRVSYNGSVSLHRRTVIWEDNVVTDPVQWVDAFRESYLNSSPTATVPSLFNNYMPYSNAWFYYDKVQTFGAVPWYDFTIAASDKEAMMKPRDSREYVMDKVLEDLTFASTYCLSDAKFTKGSALINKWVALAFKSRVCLYEGTFRKYHSREPSSDKPWQAEYNADNKFLREAAAAAKEIMDKGPYSLVTGDVKTAYRSLFTSAGLLTQEVIFGREYSKELSAFHETSWYYYSPTYGAKIAMTKKFMNTYLTTRGTPFTDIDGYQTIDFIREFDGRDARMAQTVISPTYKMKISGRERLYSPNWKVTRTGYHPIKWSIDDDADNVLSKAASWNSLPILRYAEVLLNYAEAKAELGEMDAAVWDQTIAQLRSRAGVTPVVPDKADPYMEAYFLNTVTDKWILEVRRERGIELCLEMGLRWDDDMRWHMGDLLTSDNNPWTGIWIGNTGYTYDFTGQSTDDNGDPVPDFYIRPGEDTEHSIAISNTGANQTFSLNAAGNIVWEYKRTWGEKKYLRPIPQTAITRNPNLEQNALWK